MTVPQVDLLRRIQDFRFDSPTSAHTFADRLAKENGWTLSFTERAIGEYRRFAYLAMAAGHPVSPSEVVDQVWHLHLIYTRSYWDDFCGRTLGRPLHHEPSTGGGAEREKFADWYARTLDGYRAHFGEHAPADLWPAPAARESAHEDFRRVDVARHWVIPKARLGASIAASLLAILLIMFAAGCGGRRDNPPPREWADTLNPLDFTGHQFLAFYALAFVVACVIGWRIRAGAKRSDRLVSAADRRVRALDPYAIAYLNDGPVLAANAAITKLIDRDLLTADGSSATLRAWGGALKVSLHPLERAIYNAVSTSRHTHLRDVRKAITRDMDRVAAPLIDLGYVPDPHRAKAARTLSTLTALSVPAVGLLKIGVGIHRDRPVLYLAIACAASAIIAMALFARFIRRTTAGDRALMELKVKYLPLRGRSATLEGDALALGVGLFGLPLLADTDHADLAQTLRPPASAVGGGSGGGCGSSCGGGGGAGGGGGCGGGGCGGGGCGGCGGG